MNLVPKKVQVTRKGKTHVQTVWVKEGKIASLRSPLKRMPVWGRNVPVINLSDFRKNEDEIMQRLVPSQAERLKTYFRWVSEDNLNRRTSYEPSDVVDVLLEMGRASHEDEDSEFDEKEYLQNYLDENDLGHYEIIEEDSGYALQASGVNATADLSFRTEHSAGADYVLIFSGDNLGTNFQGDGDVIDPDRALLILRKDR